MLLDVVKPMAFMLCLLSLLAVFSTAFLVPASGFEDRIWDSTVLLCFAASISFSSGMLFREQTPEGMEPVTGTLPMRVFCWATSLMVVLFALSWWLETHCIFYKDLRRF